MCHNRRIDLLSAKSVGSSHLKRVRSAWGQDLERSPEKVVDRNRVLRSEISKRSHDFERGHLKKQSRYTPLYTKISISLLEICDLERPRDRLEVKISRGHLKKLWIEIEFRGRDLEEVKKLWMKVVDESCGWKLWMKVVDESRRLVPYKVLNPISGWPEIRDPRAGNVSK